MAPRLNPGRIKANSRLEAARHTHVRRDAADGPHGAVAQLLEGLVVRLWYATKTVYVSGVARR